MCRTPRLRSILLCLLIAAGAAADPIHPAADGAYWHHDSGWIFPARLAGFERVGIPQDIEGSRDAAGWYARGSDDARVTASVDVYPLDSANRRDESGTPPGPPTETTLLVGSDERVSRTLWSGAGGFRAVYLFERGEWRVRIRVATAHGGESLAQEADAFVRAQRWEKLATR